MRPRCLWRERDAARVAEADAAPAEDRGEAEVAPIRAEPAEEVVDRWDAGGMSCGDRVLELRLRLRELPPGELFELRATDAGAPIDLPSWCGLTGHQRVDARHPVYRIRRKPLADRWRVPALDEHGPRPAGGRGPRRIAIGLR